METQRVAIVGAGVSGLLACKHCMEKGLNPIIFEAQNDIGGVWSKTLASTKLQTPKGYYQFSDFPWPASVSDEFPDHTQVLGYLKLYASHFKIIPRIEFNTKVISIDYSGRSDSRDLESWDLWGVSGEPFSPEGRWNISVQNSSNSSAPIEVHEVDFVILCIGNFSGLPNLPEFPVNKGPQVFNGVVMHAMDFAAMEDEAAAKLIAGKRVTVIGSQKSALDLAAEVASQNGTKHPCTLVLREAHWMMPESFAALTFRGFNRFSELMVHKPREGFLQWLFTSMLSPLLWAFSKMVEIYLRSVYPMKKYNMVPSYGFVEHMFSCGTAVAPPNFYDMVREGSLVPMKSPRFWFYKNGLVLDNGSEEEQRSLATDIVLFATGYKTDEKLKNMFSSSYFQKCIMGSSAPFYRECIHPRIPKLAIPGYTDSPANIYTTEMKCRWIAHYLAGKVMLPSVREMEEDVEAWEKCKKRYASAEYKRHCANGLLQIHSNDQICRDIACKPFRKSCFLAELFSPYGPSDYNI